MANVEKVKVPVVISIEIEGEDYTVTKDVYDAGDLGWATAGITNPLPDDTEIEQNKQKIALYQCGDHYLTHVALAQCRLYEIRQYYIRQRKRQDAHRGEES